MGNCVSEYKESHFRDAFGDDPSAFRVFIKRKNKFLQGWLKIGDEEIIFTRGGGQNIECWPLCYLRRYGYTRAGIFFFESGRRCKTGEGLHTFQSHQAERIFQILQLRIKHVEIRASRASSVASQRINAVTNGSASRIYPVQRFSSEGANGQAFRVTSPAPRTAPLVPARTRRPRSTGMLSRSGHGDDFMDSWPNESLPPEEDIVNEHVLRSKRKQQQCIDPICRQRKYHSYVNIDFAEPQHRIVNFTPPPPPSVMAQSYGPHGVMSASYSQPSTSSHNTDSPSFDPMSASATFGGDHKLKSHHHHQHQLQQPQQRQQHNHLSYATLSMPDNFYQPRTQSTSQRSDCSSSSSVTTPCVLPQAPRILQLHPQMQPPPSSHIHPASYHHHQQQQPPPPPSSQQCTPHPASPLPYASCHQQFNLNIPPPPYTRTPIHSNISINCYRALRQQMAATATPITTTTTVSAAPQHHHRIQRVIAYNIGGGIDRPSLVITKNRKIF